MANAAEKNNASAWTPLTRNGPGTTVSIIGGFGRYHNTVKTLPIIEQIRLGELATYIVHSYRPGNHPVIKVAFIGHADTDLARGRAFEQKISEDRACDVRDVLRDAVARISPIRILNGPHPSSIDWTDVTGAGATSPHYTNQLAIKKKMALTEAQRQRNRRVEIVMYSGRLPIAQTRNEVLRILYTYFESLASGMNRFPSLDLPPDKKYPYPTPTSPRVPPWLFNPAFLPEPRTPEYENLTKAVAKALQIVDLDTVLNSINEIKDRVNKDDKEQQWLHDFLKGVEEEIRRQRDRK